MKKLKPNFLKLVFLIVGLFVLTPLANAHEFTAGNKLYVKVTGSNWFKDSAVLGAEFYKTGSSEKANFTAVSGESNIYECTVPESGQWTNVNIGRYKDSSLNTRWNVVSEISAPDPNSGNNMIVITANVGNYNNTGYNWSKYDVPAPQTTYEYILSCGTGSSNKEFTFENGKKTLTSTEAASVKGLTFGIKMLTKTGSTTTESWYASNDANNKTVNMSGVSTFGLSQSENNIFIPSDLLDGELSFAITFNGNTPSGLTVTAPRNGDVVEIPSTGVYVYGNEEGGDFRQLGCISETGDNSGSIKLPVYNKATNLYYVIYVNGQRYGHKNGNLEQIITQMGHANVVILDEVESTMNDSFFISVPADAELTLNYFPSYNNIGDENLNGYKGKTGKAVRIEEAPSYYFIGDMNDWYSVEFERQEFEAGTDVLKADIKGINAEKLAANKKDWKFTRVDDTTLTPDGKEGWYKFDSFPGKMLTGQFQIFDGTGWTGEVYSHALGVKCDNYSPDITQHEAYYKAPITAANIAEKNAEFKITVKENDKDVVKNGIRKSNGQNLHMECNAVRNAVIWFKPGDDPKLIVNGDPTDFFIFYGMTHKDGANKDKNNVTGDNVRTKISAYKPNSNNYYLPGIIYQGVDKKYRTDDDKTLTNPGDGEHMNVGNGIELKPYYLADMGQDDLKNLFGVYNTDVWTNISTLKQLPNGIDIADYTEEKGKAVYVTKIPSGFENPAGYKYIMEFVDAINEDDKKMTPVITPDHQYYFPLDGGLHVHVHAAQLRNSVIPEGGSVDFENGKILKNLNISYRVYKQAVVSENDYTGYAVVVVKHDDDTNETTQKHELKTMLTTDLSVLTKDLSSDIRDYGFVSVMDLKNYKDYSTWSPTETEIPKDLRDVTEWNVCWVPESSAQNAPARVEGETTATDRRLTVLPQYRQAFVQFKLEFDLPAEVNATVGSGDIVTKNADGSKHHIYYLPNSLNMDATKDHYSFKGQDLYVPMNYDMKYILTGIESIEIEGNETEEAVDAAPVYYNLQGVRVANPERGIFIEVRGNKTRKVAF